MYFPICLPVFIFIHLAIATKTNELDYCSFFNNRAPTPQPGLKNCTWYRENSCCMQQEIEATFGRVKPLKGASPDCLNYVNYLMCYICAPNQNIFYQSERLTVCEESCDKLYNACNSSILKGFIIKDLYPNGKEFCKSRRFQVDIKGCFTFDVMDTSLASGQKSIYMFTLLVFCLQFSYFSLFYGDLNKIFNNIENYSKMNRSQRGQSVIKMKIILCKLNKLMKSLYKNFKRKFIIQNYYIIGTTKLIEYPLCIKKKNNDYFNLNFSILLKEGLLYTVIAFLMFNKIQTVDGKLLRELTSTDVRIWSDEISSYLQKLATDSLKYNELQNLYNDADYSTEIVNGTKKILELKDQLDKFFKQKKLLAVELADYTQQVYDSWIVNEGHKKIANNLEDLGVDIYKDADLPHRLPEELMSYDSNFKSVIMKDHSVVKIPDDVSRISPDVIDTVTWSSQLDSFFRKNMADDPSIRWQYFGSSSGVHRTFPGQEWRTNFIGFHEDYDPRSRPWYVSATSGPKDVVLILDASTSMNEEDSLEKMKRVAVTVLETLTKQDYVNVVVSKSPYWTQEGVLINVTNDILSCSKSDLVPASTSHRKHLIHRIKNIEANGGSDHQAAFVRAFELLRTKAQSTDENCQKIVVFVTDGKNRDATQRCGPGYFRYDEQNRKQYHPGRLCKYDYAILLQLVKQQLQSGSSPMAHIFSVVTSSQPADQVFPGHLACENYGAVSKVTSTTDIFKQLKPYFRFLEASSGTEDPLWTSPYLDETGLGLLVSVAVPVYSHLTKKHLGVVGIDVPLDRIEILILNQLWGSVYGFLVDTNDGNVIMHPFTKPAAQLVDDPAFIPISLLETHNNEPQDFARVMAKLKEGGTGQFKITNNALRAVSVHNVLMWEPTEYTHYFFTSIPDTGFSIALNLRSTDEIYSHANDSKNYTQQSWLDKKVPYFYYGGYNNLSPTSNNPLYPGIQVSTAESVVHLAPRSFCDPFKYLEQYEPGFAELHKYQNNKKTHCPDSLLRSDVRPDVRMTGMLEPFWLKRDPALNREITWTYVGTSSGVMRIFPGVELQRDFDPTRRQWYSRAASSPGKLAVSGVYLDSSPQMGKIVTLSKAVHKPYAASLCTDTGRNNGCPCSNDHQCKSGACHVGTCVDDVVQAVVALDIRYFNFHQTILDIIKSAGIQKYCGRQYRCTSKLNACETRCYIVDELSYIVLDPDFIDIPNESRSKYEDMSLAAKQGHVFSDLLQKLVFRKHTRIDYQGVCNKFPDNTESAILDRNWVLQNKTRAIPGPIAPFQNKYGCIKQVTSYIVNRTRLMWLGGYLAGYLDDDPCAEGTYYFTNIEGTNLYLLAIGDYKLNQSPCNFNCKIRNGVLNPGSFMVTDKACAAEENVLPINRHRSCTILSNVTVPCGFSSSCHIRLHHLLMLVVLAHTLMLGYFPILRNSC